MNTNIFMFGIWKKKKKPQPAKKPKIKGKKGGQDNNSNKPVAVFKNPDSTPMEKQKALKELEDNIYTPLEAEELELIATESNDPEKRKEAVINLFLDGSNKTLKKISKSNCRYEDTKENVSDLLEILKNGAE
ncbi:hypothetical protein KAW38_04180 [Candidatus Micrarchaeota archaeon]|nr:hypothetical protein [Candidatus Micrarchaeota archaeon]